MANNSTQYERRRVLQGLGATGLAGLAGCVGTGSPKEQPTTQSGSGGDTTTETPMANTVTGWAWDVAAKSLDLTDEPYEQQAQGENVDVKIKQMGHGALVDKFKSALVAGTNAPDFSILESVAAPSFIGTGSLAPLSGRIEGAGLKDKFVSGKWEAISKDGNAYALPWDIGPVGVFYRSDVYQEYGVDPSSITTWDQFIEEGQKLPDGKYMTNLPPNDLDAHWRMQFRQLGGKPFTDSGAINIHNETGVRAARNLNKISDAGIASNISAWSSSWFSAYGEGKIASLASGAWMEGTLKSSLPETSGKWGVYRLPAFEKGGNHATNWGGSNLCIPKQTGDAAAARSWDYMKQTLANAEMQNKMYAQFGIFPAYKPAYGADLYTEPVEFFGGQKIRQIFADLAKDIPGYRYTVDTPQVTQAVRNYLLEMIKDNLSPEEAMRKAAEQVAKRTNRELA